MNLVFILDQLKLAKFGKTADSHHRKIKKPQVQKPAVPFQISENVLHLTDDFISEF